MTLVEHKRQEILDGLGDDKITLSSSNSQAFAWGLGYYLLALFISPIFLIFLPISDPNVRITVWLLVPVPVGMVAWLILKERDKSKRIVFDANGFQIHNGNLVVFELSWDRVQTIRRGRNGFLATHLNGSTKSFRLPELELTRSTSTFYEILRSYAPARDPVEMRKKWLMVSLPLLAIGVAGAAGFGRPEMLARTYDGPIGAKQYVEVAVWAISSCLLICGFLGLSVASSMFLSKIEKEKSRRQGSRFGPNIRQFLDETQNWPKPIELAEGRRYRYIDPDGVRKAAKDQVDGLWVFFGMAWILPIIFVFSEIFGPNTPKNAQTTLQGYIASGFIIALGCTPLFFIPKFRCRQEFADDEVWVSGDSLIVKRGNRTIEYSRQPYREMRDDYPQKESRMPFGRVERYGTKPNIYELDRRYLMEISEGLRLSSQDVVGDGVQHVSG